jgi:hypothetical protein
MSSAKLRGHTLITLARFGLFLTNYLSNLVSMFTKEPLFTKLAYWPILLTN